MIDPLLIGFVFSCDNVKIESMVKTSLVELVERQLNLDDRVYIYRPDEHEVPKRAKHAISYLLMTPMTRLRVSDALERTVYALKLENFDEYRRAIFIVLDRLSPAEKEACFHVVRMSEAMQSGITFIFCDFGQDDYVEINDWPACMYWRCEIPDFQMELVDFVNTLNSLEDMDGQTAEGTDESGDEEEQLSDPGSASTASD